MPEEIRRGCQIPGTRVMEGCEAPVSVLRTESGSYVRKVSSLTEVISPAQNPYSFDKSLPVGHFVTCSSIGIFLVTPPGQYIWGLGGKGVCWIAEVTVIVLMPFQGLSVSVMGANLVLGLCSLAFSKGSWLLASERSH